MLTQAICFTYVVFGFNMKTSQGNDWLMISCVYIHGVNQWNLYIKIFIMTMHKQFTSSCSITNKHMGIVIMYQNMMHGYNIVFE